MLFIYKSHEQKYYTLKAEIMSVQLEQSKFIFFCTFLYTNKFFHNAYTYLVNI